MEEEDTSTKCFVRVAAPEKIACNAVGWLKTLPFEEDCFLDRIRQKLANTWSFFSEMSSKRHKRNCL